MFLDHLYALAVLALIVGLFFYVRWLVRRCFIGDEEEWVKPEWWTPAHDRIVARKVAEMLEEDGRLRSNR